MFGAAVQKQTAGGSKQAGWSVSLSKGHHLLSQYVKIRSPKIHYKEFYCKVNRLIWISTGKFGKEKQKKEKQNNDNKSFTSSLFCSIIQQEYYTTKAPSPCITYNSKVCQGSSLNLSVSITDGWHMVRWFLDCFRDTRGLLLSPLPQGAMDCVATGEGLWMAVHSDTQLNKDSLTYNLQTVLKHLVCSSCKKHCQNSWQKKISLGNYGLLY